VCQVIPRRVGKHALSLAIEKRRVIRPSNGFWGWGDRERRGVASKIPGPQIFAFWLGRGRGTKKVLNQRDGTGARDGGKQITNSTCGKRT